MKNKVLIKMYRDLRCTYVEDTYEYTLHLGYQFHDNMFFTFSKYNDFFIQRGQMLGVYFPPRTRPKRQFRHTVKSLKIPCKVESYYL